MESDVIEHSQDVFSAVMSPGDTVYSVADMQSKLNLLSSSVLRGLQMLFGIVILGLSITLIKSQRKAWEGSALDIIAPAPPTILPLAAAIGAISLAAAVFSLVIAWTNILREYIEMLVDVVVIMLNMVGGVIIAIKLQGMNCGDTSFKTRLGNGYYPFKGSLGGIDILNGGCYEDDVPYGDERVASCAFTSSNENVPQLNVRCKQSQTDSIFMFLTVAICFATMLLTFLRMKKSI
ncbi:hypothetical protein HBH82_085900 [Parastagonospora nodorum]|nr:hypothetical protein HBH82_085900 [Parastagonospora nodorum]KAH4696427.1 hypothetical protein HBH78_065570 [Parastagonospora nodorum]KAH4709860.1 hypothetical protein HBH67_049890 [Parastagonospora nodorum]KAH4783126.1 hypothetical protein HBH62_107680 [Parastagonospora nodorum]KAH4802377.1 hypothetical protein HBH63_067200 [Parastagonospora nodorum]